MAGSVDEGRVMDVVNLAFVKAFDTVLHNNELYILHVDELWTVEQMVSRCVELAEPCVQSAVVSDMKPSQKLVLLVNPISAGSLHC